MPYFVIKYGAKCTVNEDYKFILEYKTEQAATKRVRNCRKDSYLFNYLILDRLGYRFLVDSFVVDVLKTKGKSKLHYFKMTHSSLNLLV